MAGFSRGVCCGMKPDGEALNVDGFEIRWRAEGDFTVVDATRDGLTASVKIMAPREAWPSPEVIELMAVNAWHVSQELGS